MGNKTSTKAKTSYSFKPRGSFKPIRCRTKIGRGPEDDEKIIEDILKSHYPALMDIYNGCSEQEKQGFINELNSLMPEMGDSMVKSLEDFETTLTDCNPSDHKRIIEGLEKMDVLKIEEEVGE